MQVEQSVTDLSWHTVQRANAEHININTHSTTGCTRGVPTLLVDPQPWFFVWLFVSFFKNCPFNRKERHPFKKKKKWDFPWKADDIFSPHPKPVDILLHGLPFKSSKQVDDLNGMPLHQKIGTHSDTLKEKNTSLKKWNALIAFPIKMRE